MRPGGASLVVMRGPDGTEFRNRGVYLEIVPDRLLVATDAFTSAWQPSDKLFMAMVLRFDDEAGQTRYSARVLHWNAVSKIAHKDMGFHKGLGQCTDQMAALATC